MKLYKEKNVRITDNKGGVFGRNTVFGDYNEKLTAQNNRSAVP